MPSQGLSLAALTQGGRRLGGRGRKSEWPWQRIVGRAGLSERIWLLWCAVWLQEMGSGVSMSRWTMQVASISVW